MFANFVENITGLAVNVFYVVLIIFALITTLILSIVNPPEPLPEQNEVEASVQEYLNDRYSAEFVIEDCDIVPDYSGLTFGGPSHWELAVKSSQFPDDIFRVFYKKDPEGNWYCSDNYYTLLFREEIRPTMTEWATDFFQTACLVTIFWSWTDPWPDGVGEGSSLSDWLDAGGDCPRCGIYLRGADPDPVLCQSFTDLVYTSYLSDDHASMTFYGLSSAGFDIMRDDGTEVALVNAWINHPEWRLDRISCSPKGIKEAESYR